MSPAELQSYLYEHIPLLRAMKLSVIALDEEEAVVEAPLDPNLNQHGTGFGGSASVIAILAAWCLLQNRLRVLGIHNPLVIRRTAMEYERPITDNFLARASLEQDFDPVALKAVLARDGKVTIPVLSQLECQSKIVARFRGEFVALGDRPKAN